MEKKIRKNCKFFQFDINNVSDVKSIGLVQKQMTNSYLDYWRKSLGDEKTEDGRLYVYRQCKRNFGIEPYLKHVKKLKYRRALTVFRLSAHNLEIETGRYIHDNKAVGNDGG